MDELPVLAARARERALRIIEECALFSAWESIGAEVHEVGSIAMGLLLKHRDIDLHIYTDRLDVEASFRAMAKIASNPRIYHIDFRNLADTDEACFEWHAFCRDSGGDWQIDMIQILRGSAYDGYFEDTAARVRAALTPETRLAILTIKNELPDDAHIMGIEIYRAVLAGGVRTTKDFLRYRAEHPVDGILDWKP